MTRVTSHHGYATRLLPVLALLLSLFLPSESPAFIRQNLPDPVFFSGTDAEICRNVPVHNSDPTGLKVLVDGKDYDMQSFASDFSDNPYNRLIVSQMIDAKQTFGFTSLERFQKAVAFRFYVLEAGRRLKENHVRFGGHQGFTANSKYWRTTAAGLEPTAEGMGNWSGAIESLFSSDTQVDCGGAATICYLYALYKTLGEKITAPRANVTMISQLSPHERELKRLEDVKQGRALSFGPNQSDYAVWWKRIYAKDREQSNQSLVAGDWIYVPNDPAYDETTGDWKGEHAIFLKEANGQRILWGHGVRETYIYESTLRDFMAASLNEQLEAKKLPAGFTGLALPSSIKMYDAAP